MKKVILIFGLGIILSGNIGFCEVRTITTIEPLNPLPPMQFYDNPLIQQNYNYPNISENLLSRMELNSFNRNYSGDFLENRISRLENQFFNSTQTGNLEQRFYNIKKAANNYNSNRYNNAYNSNFYNQNKLSNKRKPKNILKNLKHNIIKNTLGYPTSYGSQGLVPFSPNAGYGIQRNLQNNFGTYNSYSDFGMGSGVKILY